MDTFHFNYIKSLFAARKLRVVAASAALVASSSWAALGGNVDSVQSDQQVFGASGTSQPISGATLHTQTLPNGTVVRQYVDPTGTVFAVGWDGPVQPDFQRLLGTHFSTYQDAQRQQRRGVQWRSNALVLESGGMMRAFVGRAYLPDKLPASLSPQDLR